MLDLLTDLFIFDISFYVVTVWFLAEFRCGFASFFKKPLKGRKNIFWNIFIDHLIVEITAVFLLNLSDIVLNWLFDGTFQVLEAAHTEIFFEP